MEAKDGILSALPALNASDHFRMAYFMNLKEESIANMIFMSCLHHAAENAVKLQFCLCFLNFDRNFLSLF